MKLIHLLTARLWTILYDIKTYTIILADQRNGLFVYCWQHDHAMLDITCFPTLSEHWASCQVLICSLPGFNDVECLTAFSMTVYVFQIRTHCAAFRSGMSDLLNLEWLRMFDQQELQVGMLRLELIDFKTLHSLQYSMFYSFFILCIRFIFIVLSF